MILKRGRKTITFAMTCVKCLLIRCCKYLIKYLEAVELLFIFVIISVIFLLACFIGARCSSVVRAFAHGAMGRRIDPSWSGPIELFLVPASAPRLV